MFFKLAARSRLEIGIRFVKAVKGDSSVPGSLSVRKIIEKNTGMDFYFRLVCLHEIIKSCLM